MNLLIENKNKNKIIPISGSKNSAVAIIPAALLTHQQVIIHNIPKINDVYILIDILKDLNHKVTFNDNTLYIKRKKTNKYIISDNVDKLRGSYYFIGVYLSYLKKIGIKSIGGCNLGQRKTNYHHEAFLSLGAKYTHKNDLDFYKVPKNKKLKGQDIILPTPSVGATINIILTSVKAKGTTTISNYAKEVEVIDLCNFLNSMKANITITEEKLIIIGVKKLFGTEYTIIPDRIEAGTYLAFGCLKTNKPVTITNINPSHLTSFTNALQKIGHKIIIENNTITASKGKILQPINIITKPFPGFPTDLGPIIAILLTQIPGTSSLTETIFSNRFSHIEELKKLGANIDIQENKMLVTGPTNLNGTQVTAHDLRCAASLLLASYLIKDDLLIKNIETLERGYENYQTKLKILGINSIRY